MSDEQLPDKLNHELAARIVAAYVRKNEVATDQMPKLIATVHEALTNLGQTTHTIPAARAPAVPIRRSVGPNFVVCLECGWQGQMLRRHIGTAHGLSVADYRSRWHLSSEHPVVAPSYSERRSGMAKHIGLGRSRVAPGATAASATSLQQPARTPRRRAARRKGGEPTNG